MYISHFWGIEASLGISFKYSNPCKLLFSNVWEDHPKSQRLMWRASVEVLCKGRVELVFISRDPAGSYIHGFWDQLNTKGELNFLLFISLAVQPTRLSLSNNKNASFWYSFGAVRCQEVLRIILSRSDKWPILSFRFEDLFLMRLATVGNQPCEQQHMCQTFSAQNLTSLGTGWTIALLMTKTHDTWRYQMFSV